MSPSPEELFFTAACGFDDPKERQAFLDYACTDNPGLRERLEEMLEIEGDAATFFEFQPEVQPEGGVAKKREEEGVGAYIGRYRLITRIGTGGCGIVYYAEQEEPVRRKVALKIVKLGMDTEAVIARFELERQALAQMDHPNIARVLDAGATASGRPYFVMELVDGEKITDFCDANHLGIRQRLELFVQVCRAIQHAHQKGLIHRDIKPSNVLVQLRDGVPVPKVIDFGIAKATAATVAGAVTFTQSGQFLGTPAYMSPEQAQGSAEVDTRSDIYSLGVLLYELLSGRTPFNLKRLTDNSMDEVRRIIREEEPRHPSASFKMATPEERAAIAANRGTEIPRLASELAGDLDWIVMKALEKERSRRYDSATGFAMDVLRYVNDEPVLARPPSRGYLLGKLVRRNKIIFSLGSIAVIGLLAGLGTSTWMFFQERAERQKAEAEQRKAELRELIAHAAVRIEYHDLAGADKLLGEVPLNQTPASLEAAKAFGAVGNWHMQAARYTDAASRYTSMFLATANTDDSDLPQVSNNLLPATAAVAYADGAQSYEQIRQVALARFGGTGNGGVGQETMEGCLLMPADQKTLKILAPMASFLEKADADGELARASPHGQFSGWVFYTLSLFHYRAGEYAKAAAWAQRCLTFESKNDVRTASMFIVNGMIEQKLGHTPEAQASLVAGKEAVDAAFANTAWLTPPKGESWYDWINAAVLLREAEQIVPSQPAKRGI